MDSHIQLPNGVLKHFRSNEPRASGRVYYLDLNDGCIHLSGSKRLGTETGYYSEEIESYLNKEIETPFTSLAAKVRSFAEKDLDTLVLDVTVEETLKRYIVAAMARSKLALNSLMKKSVTAQFMSMQANHDDLVLISTLGNHGLIPLLQSHKMLVLVNRTDRQFVVPRNCFYTVHSQGYSCIVAPISPICALELVPEKYSGNVINGEEYRFGYIDDPNIISEMNKQALRYEYSFNQTFVASASRYELEKLKTYLETNREYLESLKASSNNS